MKKNEIRISLPETQKYPVLDIPTEDFKNPKKFSLNGNIGTYKPNDSETYLLFALSVNGKDAFCYVKLPNAPDYC